MKEKGIISGKGIEIIKDSQDKRIRVSQKGVEIYHKEEPVKRETVEQLKTKLQIKAELTDVTPLTLSIETLGGICKPLIKRGTPIPVSESQFFSTTVDNQSSLEVHVLQGERLTTKDNETLVRFIIDGIPPAPRGISQIEVTFDIGAYGILRITAKDKISAQELSVSITSSHGLTGKEIEEMIREAEEHEREKQ